MRWDWCYYCLKSSYIQRRSSFLFKFSLLTSRCQRCASFLTRTSSGPGEEAKSFITLEQSVWSLVRQLMMSNVFGMSDLFELQTRIQTRVWVLMLRRDTKDPDWHVFWIPFKLYSCIWCFLICESYIERLHENTNNFTIILTFFLIFCTNHIKGKKIFPIFVWFIFVFFQSSASNLLQSLSNRPLPPLD